MKKYLKFAIAMFVVAVVLLAPTQYYTMSPGAIWNLSEMIEGGVHSSRGFAMVTVGMSRANGMWYIYGHLNRNIAVVPRTNVIPQGWDEQQYRIYSNYRMRKSHNTAIMTVAKYLGLSVVELFEGAYVLHVMPESKAEEVLVSGDVVVKINDMQIDKASDVSNTITDMSPGQTIDVVYVRDDEELSASLQLGQREDGKGWLGVVVINNNWVVKLQDYNIQIDTANIGGPSAGMMLTLQILDLLEEEDLTAGREIAGTGTIEVDGSIGRVGGVPQKIKTAEKAGVEIFILPYSNWNDVRDMKTSMLLVPVQTFADVLEFLNTIKERRVESFSPLMTEFLTPAQVA